ncbi:MAG: efflux RND transporter permease subunit [Leptospiraceae bacterium]|nr:efflux RND transporter permease subunit [Leptospiraceae bacterium]
MEKLISYFVHNKLFSILAILFITLVGMQGLSGLRRDSFPKVEFKQLVITTTFPGASPEDVELRITYPIEEKLKEIDGIDEIRSVSRNSVSDIDVRVDLEDKDPEKVVQEIRRAVDSVQNLPPQVIEKPNIRERKSGSFPIFDLSLYGGKNENALQEYGIFLEDELEKLPGVARVDVFGKRDHEWHVLVNSKRLSSRSLDIMDVVNSIRGRSINLPAGSLENENSADIRIDGEFKKIEEISKLPLKTNEILNKILVGDIASTSDTYQIPKFLAISNGKPGLILSVVKKDQSDAIATIDKVRERLTQLEKSKPSDIQTFILNDEAKKTKSQLGVVVNNAIVGFIIVFVILFLFMDLRTAILTSLSLPLALLSTFMILPSFNVTFNLVSMLGIIIALGMLVDNSIVISENIYDKQAESNNQLEASTKGTSEMVIPIFGSYLTTVAAFMPMLFMSGIMGKFIYQIPLIVIIALTASLAESFFLLPSRLAYFKYDVNKKKSMVRAFLDRTFNKMDAGFAKFVGILIRKKFISLTAIFLILVGALFAMTQMNFILFPKEDIEILMIKAEFSPSIRANNTREKMKPIEDVLATLPKEELVSYSIKIGVQQTDPNDPLSRFGEQLAFVTVYLTPASQRKRKADAIIDDIKPKISNLDGIQNLYIEELINGPPIGAAVNLSILGRDYEELKKISQEIQDYLKTIPGVISIRDDFTMGRKQKIIELDKDYEALTGVSTFSAAEAIRSVYDGNRVATLRKGKEKIYIRVLYDEEFRSSPTAIENISLKNRYESLTKLSSIAKIVEKDSPELLTHRNFERAITVLADVDTRVITSVEANDKLQQKFLTYVPEKYPGASLLFGGEEKDTEKSMTSLGKAGLIALFGIFAILALTMNSIIKPMAILSTIPLGIIGIVIGFPLSGRAISFIAMIGIIGLAGVLVNASIVLVDCIDQIYKNDPNRKYDEILVEASQRRFRPILLTTMTTMGGLLPTAYGLGGTDPVLIPMTLALGWGLGFGTFGSLVYIPVLFAVSNDISSKVKNLFLKKKTA